MWLDTKEWLQYTKGANMGDLTQNFDLEEYACKCGCGVADIKQELAVKVQQVRDLVGRPIAINSGVRCARHNGNIGASETSSHIGGWAADLGYTGSGERYQLLNAAFQIFDRVGIAKNFIHVDVDSTKSSRVVWIYS
ncbi:uncharacterized protein METZ01_LOCUS98090 [marine metagenome]|uniref:Peptidase M15A C-terminal domain-containing protein n=1 Tax=marine metagenome TaxID=408172 RepID=A0A381VY69_9ZZZZ